MLEHPRQETGYRLRFWEVRYAGSICTHRPEQAETEVTAEAERQWTAHRLSEADVPETALAVRLFEIAFLPKTAEVK